MCGSCSSRTTGYLRTMKVAIFAIGDQKVVLVSYEKMGLCLCIFNFILYDAKDMMIKLGCKETWQKGRRT